MGWNERESEGEGEIGAGLDLAEDLEALSVPAEYACEDSRKDHDHEAIRDIGNGWYARLKATFDFPIFPRIVSIR